MQLRKIKQLFTSVPVLSINIQCKVIDIEFIRVLFCLFQLVGSPLSLYFGDSCFLSDFLKFGLEFLFQLFRGLLFKVFINFGF